MLHTKFRGNQPAGSREEDFKWVFTIYGRGGHLDHVTSIMSSDFHFLVPETWKIYSKEMTLTFNTHIPSSSQLVVCIYQLSGHRLQ